MFAGRNDLLKVDIEAVSEHEHVAVLQIWFDAFVIYISLFLVRCENHDNICSGCSFRSGSHLQACFFRRLPGLAAFVQTDDHVYAAFLQVQRMSMSLAAVADNRNRFPSNTERLQSL